MEQVVTKTKSRGRRGGSRSGLFLIELMIAILFFALASAVCMQLFTRAHLIARDSRDLGEAVNRTQIAAEYFKSADGSLERMAELLDLPTESMQEDRIIILYDKQWNRLDHGDQTSVYRMTIQMVKSEVDSVIIRVEDLRGEPTEVFGLEAKKYIPESID